MGEFIGQSGIKHVSQPADSELCFAAIVSAVDGGSPVQGIHQALVESGISAEDGSTAPPPETTDVVLPGETVVTLEPFMGFDKSGLMEEIGKRFADGKAVALLHKKNDNETDDRHHWILLAGQYVGGKETRVSIGDPLKASGDVVNSSEISDKISRTVEFSGAAFACTVSVEQP
ncbi:MAG: hypothetical protein AAB971_02125 [Patescibacteria group bacterium]